MTEILPRRTWRTNNPEGIEVIEHICFGWKIHQHIMPKGSKLVLYSGKEVQRVNSPNLTLFVKGHATVKLPDGTMSEDRVPGMYSGDRPPAPAGETVIIAQEEFEFWCFNWHANRGALPMVEILRVPEATSVQLTAQQKTMLCTGTLGEYQSPISFVAAGEPLTAATNCYGFLIGDSRV